MEGVMLQTESTGGLDTKAATLKALSALGAGELPWRGWRRVQAYGL